MLLLQGLQGLQMLKVVRPGACALGALSEPTAARHTRPSTCQPKSYPLAVQGSTTLPGLQVSAGGKPLQGTACWAKKCLDKQWTRQWEVGTQP